MTNYNSKISCYDFLILFSATCACNDKYNFDKDELIKFITSCKKGQRYNKLLSEINVKFDGNDCHIDEFDSAIKHLIFENMVYISEEDNIINIQEDIPTFTILSSKKGYIEEVNNFVESYNDFDVKTYKKKKKYPC